MRNRIFIFRSNGEQRRWICEKCTGLWKGGLFFFSALRFYGNIMEIFMLKHLSTTKQTHFPGLCHPMATCEQRRSQGSQGAMPPKFLAYLVILCFERWCLKQNTVVRLKYKFCPPKKIFFCSQNFELATPLLVTVPLHEIPTKRVSRSAFYQVSAEAVAKGSKPTYVGLRPWGGPIKF